MERVVLANFETTLDPHYHCLRKKLAEKQIPMDIIPPFASGKEPVIIGVPTERLHEAEAEYQNIKEIFAEDPELFERYKTTLENAYVPSQINWFRLSVVLLVPTTIIVGIVYLLFFAKDKKPATSSDRQPVRELVVSSSKLD